MMCKRIFKALKIKMDNFKLRYELAGADEEIARLKEEISKLKKGDVGKMKKAIMISIKPEWVEKILNGKKTIEIRKTMPKCELPCKVYIYCTKNEKQYFSNIKCCESLLIDSASLGKVVAEFTLNEVEDFSKFEYDYGALVRHLDLYAGTKGDYPFLNNYLKWQKKGYAWHIDELKIYDEPKELSEFSHYIPNNQCPKKECGIDCEDCMSYDVEHNTCLELYYLHRQIKRPPQSWCYVEELENEKRI